MTLLNHAPERKHHNMNLPFTEEEIALISTAEQELAQCYQNMQERLLQQIPREPKILGTLVWADAFLLWSQENQTIPANLVPCTMTTALLSIVGEYLPPFHQFMMLQRTLLKILELCLTATPKLHQPSPAPPADEALASLLLAEMLYCFCHIRPLTLGGALSLLDRLIDDIHHNFAQQNMIDYTWEEIQKLESPEEEI